MELYKETDISHGLTAIDQKDDTHAWLVRKVVCLFGCDIVDGGLNNLRKVLAEEFGETVRRSVILRVSTELLARIYG